MKFTKILIAFIAVITVGVFSLNATESKEDFTFKFKDINNNPIVLKTFVQGIHFQNAKGKIVLLDFFGDKCPPCLMEMPELIDLQKKFKKNFQIISFQVQTRISNNDLREFVKEKGINYPVINNSDPEVFKFTDYISAKTSWKGLIPYAILFDQNGNATKVYLGLKSKQEYINDIKSLMSKK